MEDVTDTIFRRLVAGWGRPDVFVTEFASAEGMFSAGASKVLPRLVYTEEERPLVAQIWGRSPESMYRAAVFLRERGFDGIDLNMGCPVEKIVKKGCCSALIENPALAREQILATREGAGDLPVSVKTRIGFRHRQTEAWARHLLETGLDALVIHGRTAAEMSKVPADWSEIGRVVALRDAMGCETVIIGNGDVLSWEEAEEKHRLYGVDGVMIGRGIFRDPMVFSRQQRFLALSAKEKIGMLRLHVDGFLGRWGDSRPFAVMKKFFKVYIQGFRGAVELRAQLMLCETAAEVESLLDAWLASPDAQEADAL